MKSCIQRCEYRCLISPRSSSGINGDFAAGLGSRSWNFRMLQATVDGVSSYQLGQYVDIVIGGVSQMLISTVALANRSSPELAR
jgi:hypothetical protein